MDSISSGFLSLGGPKFKIQQSIPSGSIKRGPHAIVRSADLNDSIEIKRRFGEGSRPLFARDDITVNQSIDDGHEANLVHDNTFASKTKSNRSSSTESSSPERYYHPKTANYNRDKNDKFKKREKSMSCSPSPVKNRRPDKIPYYSDEQREKDRLRRLYGSSRSRSPPIRKDSTTTKRRIEIPSRRRRSTSRERRRRHSPYSSSRRDYRNRRSRTRSPPRHDRQKHSSRSSKDRDKGHAEDSSSLPTAVLSATPQYIPIPVAVPADYAAYSFPGWTAPQPPWHPSHHQPPTASHFAPVPMWPIMPQIRPPHQPPYPGMPPTLPYMPIAPQYRPHSLQRGPPPR